MKVVQFDDMVIDFSKSVVIRKVKNVCNWEIRISLLNGQEAVLYFEDEFSQKFSYEWIMSLFEPDIIDFQATIDALVAENVNEKFEQTKPKRVRKKKA